MKLTIQTAALATLVILVLAGCGGGGTGFDPPGGGGNGGGEMIAASNLGPPDTEIGVGQNASRGPAGQSFLGNGKPITKVSFQPYKLGRPTGDYVIEIWADDNNTPNKNIVLTRSDPFTTAGITEVATWRDWIPTNQFTGTNGTRYWAMLRLVNGAFDPAGCLVIKASTAPDSYRDGRMVSIDANGVCQELGYDALFKIFTRQ